MKKIIFLSILLVILSVTLWTDTFDNPISIGLGDAYLIKASGFRALGWNPANLALYENKIELSLSHANFCLTNNTLSLAYYNDLMGKVLDEADERELLNKIPDSGFGLDIDCGYVSPIVSFSYKNYALSTTVNVLSRMRFSKELFEFLIEDIEFKHYNFSDCEGEVVGFLESKIGYAQLLPLEYILPYELPPIYGGISISYIWGAKYAKITKMKSEFINSIDGATMDNVVKIKTSGIYRDMEEDEISFDTNKTFPGHGFRMDIGFLSKPFENITVGLTFKNMFGVIIWNHDCQEHVFTAYGDSLYIYSGEDEELDEQIDDTDTTYTISKIEQNIPFEIHMGGKYEWRNFDFYLDYVQGFDSSVFTSSKPKISLGAEYYTLKWLPVRVGFGFGDDKSSHYSIGSSFEFKNFEFSWACRSYFVPIAVSYSKGALLSFGMILKF